MGYPAMNNRDSIERAIWESAYTIHKKYADMDLAHNGHGIWNLAGECLRHLVIPFDRHPLACKLMQSMVDYYGSLYREAHAV